MDTAGITGNPPQLFSNKWSNSDKDPALIRGLNDNLLILLSPIAPFITEEIWGSSGNTNSIHKVGWPDYDEKIAAEDMSTIVFQVNGKLRDRVEMPVGTSKEELEKLALSSEKVKNFTGGKNIVKVIVVPDKLVNIVVK